MRPAHWCLRVYCKHQRESVIQEISGSPPSFVFFEDSLILLHPKYSGKFPIVPIISEVLGKRCFGSLCHLYVQTSVPVIADNLIPACHLTSYRCFLFSCPVTLWVKLITSSLSQTSIRTLFGVTNFYSRLWQDEGTLAQYVKKY